MPSNWVSRLAIIGVTAGICGLTFRLGSSDATGLNKRLQEWSKQGEYQPSAALFDTTEILMVYIGSSTCGPSNTPGLDETIERLKLATQSRARGRGLTFATMGIARDRNVGAGLEHLAKFGAFDELSAGRGWYNMGLVKYLYEEVPGTAATPQVLVVQRRVLGGLTRGYGPERVLARKVGVKEILDWEAAGAPLPKVERPQAGRVVGDTSVRR